MRASLFLFFSISFLLLDGCKPHSSENNASIDSSSKTSLEGSNFIGKWYPVDAENGHFEYITINQTGNFYEIYLKNEGAPSHTITAKFENDALIGIGASSNLVFTMNNDLLHFYKEDYRKQ